MLALDVVRYILHRPGAVQGIHGYKVVKLIGLEVDEVLLHTRTFKLESTIGISGLVELVGLFIVQRQLIYIDLYVVVSLYEGQGILNDGQGLQPQEVHLDNPGILYHITLILGNERVYILGHEYRQQVGKIAGGNDDTRGMYTRIAHRAFQLGRIAEDIAVQGLLAVYLAQLHHPLYFLAAQAFLLVQAALALQVGKQQSAKGYTRPLRHQLGQCIAFGQG